jgi:hypothetical protein
MAGAHLKTLVYPAPTYVKHKFAKTILVITNSYQACPKN